MQSQFTKMMVVFLLLFSSTFVSAQQALCHPTITKNLLPLSCDYILLTIDIDAGSSDYESLSLNQNNFSGPGTYLVTLTASNNNGTSSTCQSSITLLDVTPPVISTINNITAILGVDDQVILTAADFDNGSYDECSSNISFDISQSIFTCSDLGENTVVITVSDDSGNSNSAIVTININDKTNTTLTLACNDNIPIAVLPSSSSVFTADMMLEGGPYHCPDYYDVQILYNNIVRPNDSIYYTDIGKVLLGRVIDPSTGNACWGNITVTNDDCATGFNICDTKSRCETLGDCNSGHTDSDNIEWPCDLDISVPNGLFNSPTPDLLAQYLQVPLTDIKPELIWGNCNALNMAYSDQIIASSPSSKNILRTWTLINWNTGEIFVYVQTITLNSIAGACDFCDFLPWNSPVTDCASGHTLADAVEWPADITVNGSASIAGLEANPLVNNNDVKPQINSNCSIEMSFTDTYSNIGNDILIDRKWDIINWNSFNTSSYTQKILVQSIEESQRTVCITRRDGSPIDSVTLYPGNILENSGCKTFTYNANNKIVTPKKEDNDFTTGIDLSDVALLQEYLLGITELDKFQLLAGDISGSGGISAIDVLMLRRLIQGDTAVINGLSSPWRFYNVTSNLSNNGNGSLPNSADISKAFYSTHFIGVRVGDINDSYSTSKILPTTIVVLEDEIINNGETYEIPVFAKQDYRVKGLQFNIDKTNGFEFIGAGGDYFDKFTIVEYPTYYQLSWMAETSEATKDGLPVFSGTPMFNLKFRATKNDVMSSLIKFGDESHNRLIAPSQLPSYLLKFGWDNLIPVGTKNIVNRKLTVSPTLVNDQFIVSFDDKVATMFIYDIEGKALSSEIVVPNSIINTSSLSQGLYFVVIQYKDDSKEVKKIVKQ